MTNTKPLLQRVRSQQLKFLGHILRLPDEELAKTYALYVPTHGRRRPGRQRSSYLFYIQHFLLGDEEITFDPAHIASLAQERSGWKEDCGRLLRSRTMMLMSLQR